MSWEKVGKALVGVLAVATSVAALYMALRGDSGLEARLTYAYLTYPSQFSERISTTNDLLKYERLHAQVSAIGKGALDHQQVDKVVDLAQAPYLQLFAKPFEAGLVDHRTGLLIELRNKGQTPLKNVHIRLPAKGLVQIRDDSGNDNILQAPTSTIDIDTIGREGGVQGVGLLRLRLLADPPGRDQHSPCRRGGGCTGVPGAGGVPGLGRAL